MARRKYDTIDTASYAETQAHEHEHIKRIKRIKHTFSQNGKTRKALIDLNKQVQ